MMRERPRRALAGTLQQNRGPTPNVIVGFAHVALSEFDAFGSLFVVAELLGGDWAYPIPTLLVLLAVQVAHWLRVLGGLWLADGRSRGAAIVVAADIVFVLRALLSPGSEMLAVTLTVIACGATIRVWPSLELPTRA